MGYDREMGAFLEVRRAGERTSSRVPLDGAGVAMLGRAAEATVVLDHPSVSRSHAEIRRDAGGRWWVRDRGSRNGTTVNGVAVREGVLVPGDVIGVGEFALRFGREDWADVGAAKPQAAGSVPGVSAVDEGPAVTLRVLGDAAESPRIAAEHISGVMGFGRELQRTAGARERLRRLLEFAVGRELQGLSASALRLTVTADGGLAVENLAGPAYRGGRAAGEPPYISQSLLRAVVARAQPVVANNLVRLPQFQADVSIAPGAAAFSAVACPLTAGGGERDVLYVVQPPQLGSVEWLMLNSLAVEAYRQAEGVWAARAEAEARAAVERELDLARVVQIRTVPRRQAGERLDWAVSFQPCQAVGGDYVDVIRRGDGGVLLAIADVCGKGMQAALVTAAIHAVFNTLARTGAGLGEVAAAANRHLREFLPEGEFATLAAVELDPETGRGACVNCGHPPVLAAADGGVRLIHGGGHLPLGLAEEEGVMATEGFELARGECLVMHTDGLSEARDAAGVMLGLEGLREEFARVCGEVRDAEGVVEAVSVWFRARCGGGAAGDDQTFLVARRV